MDANEGDHVVFRDGVWVAEGINKYYIEALDSNGVLFDRASGGITLDQSGNAQYKVRLTSYGVDINDTEVAWSLVNNNQDITTSISYNGTIDIATSLVGNLFRYVYLQISYKGISKVFPIKLILNNGG